jgi:hypothetical protein
MKYWILVLLILSGCGGRGKNPPKPPDPKITCDMVVSWEIPVERTDGSELLIEDIAKYTIFVNEEQGVQESTLELEIDIMNQFLTQWRINKLDKGDHWFYMTVTDSENRESTFSNEIPKTC